MTDAWFDLDGDAVVPRPSASAPWSPDMLHGRLLAGLAARGGRVTVRAPRDVRRPLESGRQQSSGRLDFINGDITLNIARLPTSDWLGYETVFHQNADGVSAASCVVHELDGPIALSSVSSILY